MSFNRDDAVRKLSEVFRNNKVTNELFGNLEQQLQQREQQLRTFHDLVNSQFYQERMKQFPEFKDSIEQIQVIASNTQETINYLKIIHLMIEALVIKQTTDHDANPDPELTITERDRQALDWIHRYMKHERREDSEQ